MDPARREVFAFVFRPLNGAEVYLSGFTGDYKDTRGYFEAEKSEGKSQRGEFPNRSVGYSCLVS